MASPPLQVVPKDGLPPQIALLTFTADSLPSSVAGNLGLVAAGALGAIAFTNQPEQRLFWLAGAALCALFGLWMFARSVQRRSARYSVTAQRLDIERGFLAKRYESIDLWRVRDVVLEQTLLERLRGAGRLTLFSSDQVEPVLTIGPLRGARPAYDKLRDAVTQARRDARVLPIDSGK